MSGIKSLKLKNLTAFEKLDLKFSPGVNVLIGENGTGKTHLLKVLYTACAITEEKDREKGFGAKLRNVFNPYEGRIGRLARRVDVSSKVSIVVETTDNAILSATFSNHTDRAEKVSVTGEDAWGRNSITGVFIPVKEMLAHAPGFRALYAKREIAFEEVYPDLVDLAFLPKLKGPTDNPRKRLLVELQKAIEGKVVVKGEHFFLQNNQGDLEFSLLAEGIRKLALIWLLIQNGTLQNGSVLFWDEPEAHLNPARLGDVVGIILELQRLGVQVFLSTHNYVLLKEFDLMKKDGDKVSYISLYRETNGSGVTASTSDNYDGIEPNAISDTFGSLYDREIERSVKAFKQ